MLVHVDSQVHKPTCLFPRAGSERGPQQRSLSQHPGPGDGKEIVCTELSVALLFSALTTTPGCTDSMSTKVKCRQQMRWASCSPWIA